ncbi:hypothetical protein [Psychroserpens damuponensis]|uniref:hypothetical protein n=1 Tax=Psychroserpens damuponensis TaxID=943936 RepID=UPI00058F09DB|nr:hypothetical protein [Psychroserpens damuponensis]
MNKKSVVLKYAITKEDLLKRSHGFQSHLLTDSFLNYITEQQKQSNPLLSVTHISKVEKHTLKHINYNIVVLLILAVICLGLGWYQFMYQEPQIAVNLYTKFPLISNGSVAIAGSIVLFIGCVFSYIKRDAVLVRLVKSKLIEDLKREQRDNNSKPVKQSKKRQRFKQSFKVGKSKK